MMRAILVIASVLSILSAFAATPDSEDDLRRRAEQIHSRHVSLDSHTDAPYVWQRKGYRLAGSYPNCVTIGKMESGRLDAQYLAAYTSSCYTSKGQRIQYPLTARTFANRRAETLKLLNLARQQIAANSDRCGLATTADDILRLKAQGKRSFLLAVENGLCIGHDVDFVDSLAALGVTYITLTHVYDNQLCTSSSHTRDRSKGLTDTGRRVVERMNRLGIIIDLSHCSERTFYDVLNITTRPVVCTHSGVKALHNHDRNLTDAQLRALARNGGVIQIVAYHGFLAPGKTASLGKMIDHIDHAVRIAGIDHVGIGTDFDGGGKLTGLKDDSEFINITIELLRRGYSEADIAKILGGNFMRVLQQNENSTTLQ